VARPNHREQIFALRAQLDPATHKPYSYSKIAAICGVSKSLVQKELNAEAARAAAGVIPGPDPEPPGPTPRYTDPLSADRRAAAQELDRARWELQKLEIEARTMEARRKLQLLQSAGVDQGSATSLMLIQQLHDLQTQVMQLAQRAAAPPPASGRSIFDELDNFQKLGEVLKTYAPPPRAASTVDELQLNLALRKLDLEDRRISKKIDAELEALRDRAASERARNEAIARLIDGIPNWAGPALQRWMQQQEEKHQAQLGNPGLRAIAGGQSGAAAQAQELAGECPRCRSLIGINPEGDKCPACGVPLIAQEGQIVVFAPPEGDGEVQRFAS
jgi:hypothetical protein